MCQACLQKWAATVMPYVRPGSLIQGRAAFSAPPSSQPSPGKENKGLEKLLPPVTIIAPLTSTASGGWQSSGHLSRRLRYQVPRVMLL